VWVCGGPRLIGFGSVQLGLLVYWLDRRPACLFYQYASWKSETDSRLLSELTLQKNQQAGRLSNYPVNRRDAATGIFVCFVVSTLP